MFYVKWLTFTRRMALPVQDELEWAQFGLVRKQDGFAINLAGRFLKVLGNIILTSVRSQKDTMCWDM